MIKIGNKRLNSKGRRSKFMSSILTSSAPKVSSGDEHYIDEEASSPVSSIKNLDTSMISLNAH